MTNLYPRVIRFVNSQPWALMPEALSTMRDLLEFRSTGGRLTQEEIRGRLEAGGVKAGRARERRVDDKGESYEEQFDFETGQPMGWRSQSGARLGPGQGVVSVIGVIGIISQRASMADDLSGPGGTSTQSLTNRFRNALNDSGVKAIVFDHDSPGGGVYGVQELADEIRGARGQKPIEAVANSLMASASYWLGSACERLSVTPAGELGSIGCYAAHVDISKALELEGSKVTLVAHGENKVLGNPYEPLSAEARSDMEKRVGEYGRAFESAVAKGRGLSVERVRKEFGGGLVFGARESVERGMADGVATLDEVVRRLTNRRPPAADPGQTAGLAQLRSL